MELQWAAIQQLGAAKELKKHKREDALVVVGGGVIPPQDFEARVQAGAAAIPPGTVITEATIELLEKLARALGIAP